MGVGVYVGTRVWTGARPACPSGSAGDRSGVPEPPLQPGCGHRAQLLSGAALPAENPDGGRCQEEGGHHQPYRRHPSGAMLLTALLQPPQLSQPSFGISGMPDLQKAWRFRG